MDRKHEVTGRLDDAWLADLDRVCQHLGIDREHAVATAVLRFVNEEDYRRPSEFDDLPHHISSDPLAQNLCKAERDLEAAWTEFLKPAEDDLAAGRVVAHEDVMREMRERYSIRDAAE